MPSPVFFRKVSDIGIFRVLSFQVESAGKLTHKPAEDRGEDYHAVGIYYRRREKSKAFDIVSRRENESEYTPKGKPDDVDLPASPRKLEKRIPRPLKPIPGARTDIILSVGPVAGETRRRDPVTPFVQGFGKDIHYTRVACQTMEQQNPFILASFEKTGLGEIYYLMKSHDPISVARSRPDENG